MRSPSEAVDAVRDAAGHDIRRLIGTALPDAQLTALLDLTPLTGQSVRRFFQSRTDVQLRKGQSDRIAQVISKTRCRPLPPVMPAREGMAGIDPDLPGLATEEARELAVTLSVLLKQLQFDRVNRELRHQPFGGDYALRPFPLPISVVDIHAMKLRLRSMVKAAASPSEGRQARRIQQAFSLFVFGESLPLPLLEELLGGNHALAWTDQALRLGLLIGGPGRSVRANGLSLFSRRLRNGEVVHLFADTPPHFEMRIGPPRVYAGADSYELMERVSDGFELSGCCVEMGSGSGIQLIAALKQQPRITRAVGTERDRRALHLSRFNAALNGVADRMVVVDTDEALRAALGGGPVSFAMSNPPFLALPAWMAIDPQDQPMLADVMAIRATPAGCCADVRSVFPAAGWGGDDGLEVTRQFVDVLRPLLACGAQLVIYSQFAGDNGGPRALEDYVRGTGDLACAFEPAPARTVVVRDPQRNCLAEGPSEQVRSAADAAITVARLLVAAVMAQRDPSRLGTAIRNGGPAHRLLVACARRIADGYQRQGITHFHDGFAVLTKQRPLPATSL